MPIELNYFKSGSGPALIILHGLFGSCSNWRRITKALATDFTVFALDARNHGDSPWTPTMSHREMAADVAHFIDRHAIYNASILGHSMGGKTAMALAHEHPDKLDKLIVADMAPRAYLHGDVHLKYINAMMNLDLGRINSRREAESILANQLHEPTPIIQFLLQNLVRKENHLQWRINLNSLSQNLSAIMAEIYAPSPAPHPSLFLYGQNSDYLQPDDYPPIRSSFPQADFAGLANAGHWLHAEQPIEFINKVRQFLNKSSGSISR